MEETERSRVLSGGEDLFLHVNLAELGLSGCALTHLELARRVSVRDGEDDELFGTMWRARFTSSSTVVAQFAAVLGQTGFSNRQRRE